MTTVIKRDGRTELYDSSKVRKSIEKAVLDADKSINGNKPMIIQLVNDVSTKVKAEGKIESKVIRDMILTNLDRLDPASSRSWREFDSRYKERPCEEV